MTVAIVAEKPSVGRDIAAVLGARTRGEGLLSGGGYVVTWAIGHLVGLGQPHDVDPALKRWSLDHLPILPPRIPLVVLDEGKDQFANVRRVLRDPRVDRVICATDAGREGELIFRLVYEAAQCELPVERLWLSSLTEAAIREGFRRLRPSADYDPLARAAYARSVSDWLVGMNLSRLYSLRENDDLSVGRVQTPTLAILVDRELAVRAFVPEDYLEVVATFETARGPAYDGRYIGQAQPKNRDVLRFPPDGAAAREVKRRVAKAPASIESVTREEHRLPAPRLYDLNELQRHANRLYGFTAQRTLDLAQALYERHKLLSYPRTDSRHLSTAVAATLPAIVAAIAPEYPGLVAPTTHTRPLSARFVDDTKVTDHHAIVPTEKPRRGLSLSADEARLYDLVARRLLSAWHPDHVYASTEVITLGGVEDRFLSRGTAVLDEGWKVLDVKVARGTAEEPLLPADDPGTAARVLDVKEVKKRTRPPPHYTDATLLSAMESAGRQLDDEELGEALRECGLGTPATRAATVETLLRRGFVVREAKALRATDKGIALIETVDPAVKSPAMTGEWERDLRRIERGRGTDTAFLDGIRAYVRDVVARETHGAPKPRGPSRGDAPRPALGASSASLDGPSNEGQARPPLSARSGDPIADLPVLLRERFGHGKFRPHQRDVCEAVARGEDVLLVMPTGAGKSLCYQLPGLARGGTTVVVSPLIALMDDQVQKLTAQGLRAARLHSGLSREQSREVVRSYLRGTLDYLYLAPERLKLGGLVSILQKRPPSLVAIDEAHCISQWGHDFRPDYRTLGETLEGLRPAPVIALTATATPRVQEDIVSQLRLPKPSLFVHGFRRDNLAVEVVRASVTDRPRIVAEVLAPKERRPAIVYAPTRKVAEALADGLAGKLQVGVYHAGMPAAERERVQDGYVRGKIDVVVATVAFGMGVDKADVRTVVHAALPASVAGYYQEIGRAGRDGKPAHTLLLHSYADIRTLSFFFERDYPEPHVLDAIYDALAKKPLSQSALRRRVKQDEDTFAKALEKLWVAGGVTFTEDDDVVRGDVRYRKAYLEQRTAKEAESQEMQRFAETPTCRMVQLVRHFGDGADDVACGLCDVCAPATALATRFRAATVNEENLARRVLDAIDAQPGITPSQIQKALGDVERDDVDGVVAALARSGALRLEEDRFKKEGREIVFSRIYRDGDTPARLPMQQKPARAVRAAKAPAKKRAKRPRAAKAAARSEAPREESASPVLVSLKRWRLEEARIRRVPAFRILTDRALEALVRERPRNADALLAVEGFGPSLVRKYGRAVLAVLARDGTY